MYLLFLRLHFNALDKEIYVLYFKKYKYYFNKSHNTSHNVYTYKYKNESTPFIKNHSYMQDNVIIYATTYFNIKEYGKEFLEWVSEFYDIQTDDNCISFYFRYIYSDYYLYNYNQTSVDFIKNIKSY